MFSYTPRSLTILAANQELKNCFDYLRKNDIEPTELNLKELKSKLSFTNNTNYYETVLFMETLKSNFCILKY